MNSSDGDGDGDGDFLQSTSQRQLVGRHYRQGDVFEDIFTMQVYDIRNKMQIIPVKYETFNTESILATNSDAHRDAIAERYGVTNNIVFSDAKKREVVICDDQDVHIVFISFQPYRNPRAPVSLYTEQGCICLVPGTTVRTLKQLISQSGTVQTGQNVCLFVKGKRLGDDVTVESCVERMGHVFCIEEKKLKVSCFHRPRRSTENKYTLECMNTHNVRELKEIFKMTFSDDFPDLQTGSYDVWFTQGKHVSKDEELIFINFSSRSSLQERGRLLVHVKPASSFPVTVKVTTSPDNKDNEYFSIFVSELVSTSQLRSEISVFLDHHPNSLQLSINNKKLRHGGLSSETGFIPNCTVTVRVLKKINVTVLVEQHNTASLKKMHVKLYKLDTVQHLKKLVSDHLAVDQCDIQMFFEEQELLNEKLLQEYRIRGDDILYAVHFHDSIHLLIRQPGQKHCYLTVRDFRQSTVKAVKRYLADALDSSVSSINIIHMGRCLDNEDSLFEAGLSSGDTLLVPRLGVINKGVEEIRTVFISTPENSFHLTKAVEKAGILFYAPNSISVTSIEERLSLSKTEGSCLAGMMSTTTPGPPPSPRGSTSSTISLHHCYRTLFGVVSSAESESGKSPLDKSPTKKLNNVDEVLKSKRVLNRPSTKLIVPDYHSDPGPSALKRFTMCKELTKEGDKVIFRESSLYEEDVSNDSEGSNLPLSRKQIPTSSECDTSDATSPQPKSFRSPNLIFPPQVIQNTVLRAVSQELGHSWKRVALTLGLSNTDLENLEYRHHGNLHEQALQALLLWKQRSSRLATIDALKVALKESGLALVADAVDENLKFDTT